MTIDLALALVLFAFVTSVTPGPNNLMLMASGANFGFRRSIPHMMGITLGFGFMILLLGAGLVQIFDRWPLTHRVLSVASFAYLLYLAWKIATTSDVGKADRRAEPMTFLQAAAFQWVNPKAWTMGLTAVTAYAPDRSILAVLWVAVIFATVGLPSIGSWTVLGQQMRRFLTNQARLRIFNLTMATLLVLSMVPVLLI